MSKYSLNADNFLRTLPEVLQNDPSIQALASAIASELETLAQKVQLAEIYTHIDDLDETMLDALAADFKVDWWRPDASISEKRAALKASWYIHKHLGTKSAIETAVADYLGDGKVEEWFEYGGKPYHFRVSSKTMQILLHSTIPSWPCWTLSSAAAPCWIISPLSWPTRRNFMWAWL